MLKFSPLRILKASLHFLKTRRLFEKLALKSVAIFPSHLSFIKSEAAFFYVWFLTWFQKWIDATLIIDFVVFYIGFLFFIFWELKKFK